MRLKHLAIFFYINSILSETTIYLIPWSGYKGDEIFNIDLFRDNITKPVTELKKALKKIGFDLKATTKIDSLKENELVLVYNVPTPDVCNTLLKFPKNKKILFISEPPTTLPENYDINIHKNFSRIYTWNDLLVDNKTYFKYFYPQPSLQMIQPIDFKLKKFCTLIHGGSHCSSHPRELYSARLSLINFFEKLNTNDFEFYGTNWPNTYKNYRGPIPNKVNCLKNYKFCIAYENMRDTYGYITEKIFDCFVAGCVPVYWGAKNITDYIPKNCFIDRRNFKNTRELYSYLKTITEEEYNTYITNIRAYLSSDKAQLFSIDNLIKITTDAIYAQLNIKEQLI